MTYWDEERRARAALTFICEAGDGRLNEIVTAEGASSVVATLRRGDTERSAWAKRAAALDIDALLTKSSELGLRFIVPSDPEWPTALDDLDSCCSVGDMRGAPFGLWACGPADLAESIHEAIAIVGSRAATHYGTATAAELAAGLAGGEPARTIISGGAYGIDAAAHKGALAIGRSIAVYAGGLHEGYPRGNGRLFETMKSQHLVVSEAPPGLHPTRASFLARNRLIAALAQGIVVVESASRSGALNTASWGDSLGRVVMAVPGPVTSSMSVGCHRLIRDGRATLVTGVDDVLAMVSPLGRGPELPDHGPKRPLDDLQPTLFRVREVLPAHGACAAGEVSMLSGLPVADTLSALWELSALGHAACDEEGKWRLAS